MENELPDGWELRKLSSFTIIVMGQSPLSKTYNNTKQGLPFYQGKKEFGKLHPVPVKWCSSPLRIAEKGDILMSVRAPVGSLNVANEKCCIGRGLCAIRVKELVNQDYLWFYLRLKEKDFSFEGRGTTFDSVSKDDVYSYQVPIPFPHDKEKSLKIQKQIVAKLDQFFKEYDILKEEKEKAKENYEKILQSVIEKTIFFDKIPKGWKNDKLCNLCKNIQYGFTANSVNEKVGPIYLRITDINANGSLNNEFKYVQISDDDYKKFKLHKGDIVIARTGATVGKSFILKEDKADMVFASYLIRFEVDKEKILPELLNMYLNSLSYWNHISDKQVGIGQPNVNATKLGDFEIAYPEDLNEQKDLINKILSLKKDCAVVIDEQKILDSNLSMLPHSVLTKAFTGELA